MSARDGWKEDNGKQRVIEQVETGGAAFLGKVPDTYGLSRRQDMTHVKDKGNLFSMNFKRGAYRDRGSTILRLFSLRLDGMKAKASREAYKFRHQQSA